MEAEHVNCEVFFFLGLVKERKNLERFAGGHGVRVRKCKVHVAIA